MKKFIISLITVLFATTVYASSDNVVILLDTSGSMSYRMRNVSVTRLQAAQEALVTVTGQLPTTTKVGVLTFNGWSYELQAINKDELARAIRGTEASGGTPLGEYIKKAADRLLQERKANKGFGTYKLLVVTDGEADNQRLLNRHVKDIVSRGIVLNTIGVDMSSDHALKRYSKKYMSADDPGSLTKAVSVILAEVKGGDDRIIDFGDLNGLSEEGAKAIVGGVVERQDHEVGEVVKFTDGDGLVHVVSVDGPASGSYWWLMALFVVFVVGIILIVIYILNR